MPKILLAAHESTVEPLGLMYLATVARQEGWEPIIRMFSFPDDLYWECRRIDPDAVGLTSYTGGHADDYDLLGLIKEAEKDIITILGGPHASYFPADCLEHADFVVVGNGIRPLRDILSGKARSRALHYPDKDDDLPLPDRRLFYASHEEHGRSPIKSVIASSGCPFACTYCYNSMKKVFPNRQRPVAAVIAEVADLLKASPDTEMIYFQDDVFGAGLEWLREFSDEFMNLDIPFHAQTRFEMVHPNSKINRERIRLLRVAGCTGLTLAIESADGLIREGVLNRKMNNEVFFTTLKYLSLNGFAVRTEQMLGLPCGATNLWTETGIDADLKTLQLNVELRERTRLPTMAWASVFVPYKGTKIWEYCDEHGFYTGDNSDAPATFFEESRLRFPKEWTGPRIMEWMDDDELAEYRRQMLVLRDWFSTLALIPNGDVLARRLIETDGGEDDFQRLLKTHLYDNELYGVTK